jgi:hypothetical protein
MSDVALTNHADLTKARNLIMEIAGHCWRGRGDMLDRVHDAIRHLNPQTKITRRRVRAWFHREAAGVRFHEMIELAQVAQAERERRLLQEARRSHADYIARAANMATALTVQDEEFHRAAIEAFSRIARPSHDFPLADVASRGAPVVARGDAAGGTLGTGDRI